MDEITEFMTDDHHRIDGLWAKYLEAGADLQRAITSIEEFQAVLMKHIDWEEQYLFPAFESKGGSETEASTDAMRLQHVEMIEQIESLKNSCKQGASARSNLEAVLREALSNHNAAEEGYIYPWIDGCMSDQERQDLLNEMQSGGKGGKTYDTKNTA